MNGSLSVETFLTTIILSLGIAGPLLAAMDFVDSLAKVGTIAGSIELILKGEEQEHGEEMVTLSDNSISLKDVSFGYHEGKEILHDISLEIPVGTMTVFVGPSGSGKTTMCNLIARFWDVDSGTVKIGGRNVREYTLESLMNQISMVFQNVYLFVDTIENNIRFGKPEAPHEDVVRRQRRRAVMILSPHCRRTIIPSSARAEHPFPAGKSREFPLPGQC